MHILTQNRLSFWLKKWLPDGQMHKYTLHSLRHGGATWAYQTGMSGECIKKLGDWHSDAYMQYLDSQLDDKIMAMLMFTDNVM